MTEFQRNFYQRKLTKPFRIKLFVALSSSWDHFTNAEMAENGAAQKLSSLTLRLMIHPRLLLDLGFIWIHLKILGKKTTGKKKSK